MTTTLVIPDTHCQHKQTLRRFSWLNSFIKDTDIDNIVAIGDWCDMPSLSSYDKKGSKTLEQKRIKNDVMCGYAALDVVLQGITTQKFVFVEGNHENRIDRFEEDNPQLEDLVEFKKNIVSVADNNSTNLLYVPYKEYYTIDDVDYTHIPHNGVKPIESVYGPVKVLGSCVRSTVYGHTHKLAFASIQRNNSGPIYGLNVGCYIEPQHDPAWKNGKIKDWWRGIVLVETTPGKEWDGRFTTVSLAELKRRYG